mmetsp:Transcript_32988/g.59522  ORF Transcript_32988/g.59522 Transcript_32988/m.59522 type:complete len:101 (-) Transcript_32988:19-321(-)
MYIIWHTGSALYFFVERAVWSSVRRIKSPSEVYMSTFIHVCLDCGWESQVSKSYMQGTLLGECMFIFPFSMEWPLAVRRLTQQLQKLSSKGSKTISQILQ